MSQHDFNIANQGFPNFRSDLNNALAALASLSSGTAEPSTTYANQLWYETDTNKLWIRNEGNSAWLELMVIDQTTGSPSFNSGNVGIGTTAPGTLLHLYGSTTAGENTILRVQNGNTDGYGILGFGDTDDSFIGGIQYDHADNSMNFFVNNSYRMTITSAGNVGIATDDPATKLHVVGDTVIEDVDGAAASGPTLYLRRTSDSPADDDYLGTINFQGTNSVGDNTVNYARIIARATDVTNGVEDGSLTFWVSQNGTSSRKMELLNSGDLDLNGGGTTAGGFSFGGVGDVVQYRDNTNATTGAFNIYSNWGATNRNVFRVRTDGNVLNYNNSYGALSDAKLKENVADATPKLDDLCKLRVVNFNYIGDESKQLGLIAQEVEQVFPKLVDDTPDTDADGNETGEVTKSVKYSILVPMLVKAMQEQQELISSLEARVIALGG